DGHTLFVDIVAPPPRLMIFGAVDFAAQLAAAAKLAGWRAFVVDPRKRFASADRFPDAERVIAAWPDKALEELGGIDRATSIAVLTHDPKLDDAVLKIALRSEAQYIGAMGSRRAQQKRRERLLAEGLTDEELGRLAAPIGLDIGALSAAETAISIMGEITAVRRGREGGRLKTAGGRIHDAAPDREAVPARGSTCSRPSHRTKVARGGGAPGAPARAPTRWAWPADRRPAPLGGGSLQLPLPVLHARRRPALARPFGDLDLRGDPAAGRAARVDGRRRSEVDGRGATGPPGVPQARLDAAPHGGPARDLGHYERLPPRARCGGPGAGRRRPVQRVGGLAGPGCLLQDH